MVLGALGELQKRRAELTPQSTSGATYANKIVKSETRIDWTKPWNKVHDHCRGLSPIPGAWFEIPSAGRVKVLRTARAPASGKPGQVLRTRVEHCVRQGAVRLVELQRAGGKTMSADGIFARARTSRAAAVLG